MSDELRRWAQTATADELRRKVEELAGLVEMFYEIMMALDKAEAALRAPRGGES